MHWISSYWSNAGIESVQTDPMQALNQFKLIQGIHWVCSNWSNAGIESVQTDPMQALNKFKLTQCRHWISLYWWRHWISGYWCRHLISFNWRISLNWSNADIEFACQEQMLALDQLRLNQCRHTSVCLKPMHVLDHSVLSQCRRLKAMHSIKFHCIVWMNLYE
jgi:hypothetical protein